MNILRFLTPKSNVACLDSDSTVRQGLEKLFYHGYRAIPVISRSGKYVGTVTEGDFLKSVMALNEPDVRLLEKIKIDDIVRKDWNPAVNVSERVERLFLRMTEQNFVPVVDDRGVFVGIVTRKDVMKFFCDRYFDEPDPEMYK